MGLMNSLYVGSSGLRTSQNALNTTAHNLTNVDTKGYVRQQTVLRTTTYHTIGNAATSTNQVGLGVTTETVRQVRNAFLDKSYRQELGRQGFYDSQYETVNELENIFGELNGVAFQNSLEDFWVSLQELSKEPDSLVTRNSLVQTAVGFMERASNITEQINSYQRNLNTNIEAKVTKINDLGQQIKELNDKITFYESTRIENANDLRDARNVLLDELGQIVNITYKEDPDKKVSVSVEGVPFVTESQVYNMGTMTVLERKKIELGASYDETKLLANENSDLLIPVWPGYGNTEVFNFDVLPSSVNDTDIGSLKGLLLSRGEKVGKYIDIPVAPVKDNYKDASGILDQATYDKDVAAYKEKVGTYNKEVESSMIIATQAQFDQLVHGLVTTLNDILCPNKEVTIAAGTTVSLSDGSTYTYTADTTIRILDEKNASIGTDGPPGTMGEELFSRKSMPRYMDAQNIDIKLPDGTTQTISAKIYNEEDATNNYSLYTLGEVGINPEILENVSKIPLSANDGSGDYDMEAAKKLVSAWDDEFATLSPNTLTMNTFKEYYNAFIGNIATNGEMYNSIATNQAGMVNMIEEQRLSVTGVSSDDELASLIQFQHAYNASARYINVIDEMLEHIITRL